MYTFETKDCSEYRKTARMKDVYFILVCFLTLAKLGVEGSNEGAIQDLIKENTGKYSIRVVCLLRNFLG